ncbi:hypothetical protein KUL25_17225 [Rhodobacteraceae bacterium N5(2021)]|uniref:Uncharacterized protein n=1 Tax=Gymnodinialimonas phycosphaerae TaxID=2841589 RepID=A0A975TT68_9RHOB|nr:hypothetical protein [Gymnodinialimonas phycosphaerae]MBY4894502.1 hypothetical protein [Gymnodinialimonas phycosphaerae]
MTATNRLLLKISSVLWVIWGLVHMFAGMMTISQGTAGAVAGIADAVDPSLLVGDYHAAVGAVLNQHGFNLLWIGAFTVVGGVMIWRQSIMFIFMTAIVGWVTDVGYFIFMDLGGFVNFIPGTVMTIISSAAVVLSLWAYFLGTRRNDPEPTIR